MSTTAERLWGAWGALNEAIGPAFEHAERTWRGFLGWTDEANAAQSRDVLTFRFDGLREQLDSAAELYPAIPDGFGTCVEFFVEMERVLTRADLCVDALGFGAESHAGLCEAVAQLRTLLERVETVGTLLAAEEGA